MKQVFINKKDWLYAVCLGLRASQKIAQLFPTITRPSDLFGLTAEELTNLGFSGNTLTLLRHPEWSRTSSYESWLTQSDHHIITWDDPRYPSLLKEINDPPLLLHVKGDATLLNKKQLAIVGSRRASLAAQTMTCEFAKSLVASDITITSGLALGIDAQAHQGALNGEGKTVAVVATGLDQVYPARHEKLAQRIVALGGAIVSEHALHTPPSSLYFPQRNRIISGLSQAVLVVEAALRSGSLVTARHAMEQGREVLAVPGSVNNPMAKGSNNLIKEGARMVTSVADILQYFDLDRDLDRLDDAGPGLGHAKSNELTKEDKKLLHIIGYELTAVDDIVAQSGLPARTVTSRLMELTLRGQVQATPGGYIQVMGA